MRILKRIAFVILGLALLIIALNYGVSYWISKKLPTVIQNEKNFPYNFSYENLDISLLNGSLSIDNASIAPKDSTETALQKGVFGKIKNISISNFSVWALLWDDKIKVRKVTITTPDIILYEREKKYNAEEDFVKPFKNTIMTESLEIQNGEFKMVNADLKFLMKANNVHFTLDDIKVDSASVADNIPVRYTGYNLKCDSLYYKMNEFYNLYATNVSTTDTTFNAKNLRLVPEYSRVQYTRMLPEEKDLFTVTVKDINVPKAEWGFVNNILYVHSPRVVLNQVSANIFRSKMPKDDPTIKKLYSRALRELDFDLKIDRLLLKNSLIEYEEQVDFSKPAAKVSLSKFYATAANLYSPVNKNTLPNTVIDVECMFMRSTPLKLNWFWNTLDASDSFTIKGDLGVMKSEDLNPVATPLMNISTTGTMKDIKFTVNGNVQKATGEFAIKYEDLKVDIYKKDGKTKNKVMSAIGNLIVKNDSDDELKKASLNVVRLKDKSVFNLLWRSLQDGLKKTLLPKVVTKLLPEDKAGKKQKEKDEKRKNRKKDRKKKD